MYYGIYIPVRYLCKFLKGTDDELFPHVPVVQLLILHWYIYRNGSVRSAVLKVNDSPPTVCSAMIHHQQEQQQSSSSRNTTRHHSLSSCKSRMSSIAESISFGGSRQRQPNRKKQMRHGDSSECAYGPLRQTVTLSQVAGPDGRKHWRAYMVNGRDALSNSLDSL